MTDLAKLVVRLEAQTAQYMQQLDAATRKLDKFTQKSSISAKSIATGVAAAAVAGAVAFAALSKSAIDTADDLSKMAQKTGISTESLSQLKFVADLSGTSMEGFAKGTTKLSRAMYDAADGLKETKDAFKQANVEFQNSDGTLRKTEEVLLDVADKFKTLEDGAGKAALAQKLFGKSGVDLIPLLNQGRDGIESLKNEADALGLTLSEGAGKAAEEFNDNLHRLGSVGTGVVNQFVQKALPLLVALSENFIASAKSGGALSSAVGVLAITFKALVTAGVIVSSVFQQLGRIVYGVAAAIISVVKGDFRIAADELKDAFSDATANVTDDIETITKIWGELPAAAETMVKETNTALKESLVFNDEAASDKAKKATAAAVKSLKSMKEGIDENVATFGMGEVAAIQYRLTVGSLADTVKAAGVAGKVLTDSIISQSQALEQLQLNDAIVDLDNQIKELTGDTVTAAGAMFDLQNKALKVSLSGKGNEAGLQALNRLREMTVAQAEFNKLEEQAVRARTDLSIVEEQIQNSREIGAKTELQSLQELDAARAKTAAQLQVILDKQTAIATSSGNTAMIDAARQASQELQRLNTQTDLFTKKIRTDVTSVLEDGIYTSMTEGFSKGAKGVLQGFTQMIDRLVAQALAAKLAEKLFGTGGSGGGSSGTGGGIIGGLGKVLGGLFGGSRDSGGRGQAGQPVLIGTGAQPEMFVPDSAGSFFPAGQQGGKSTTNIFVQGTINDRTVRQIDVNQARRQRRAMRTS